MSNQVFNTLCNKKNGLLFSFLGIAINKEVENFMKEFGLIIFVYAIGLQVGPGFFASLKKTASQSSSFAR